MTRLRHRVAVAALAAGAMATVALAQGVADMTDGEIRRIDQGKRKLTLKHGEIKNLGMPPMAMEFEVADTASMAKLKAGDKVRFQARFEAGKYIVTRIEPRK